ncbi:MAG: Lpg1974 family pore-forming outer membrane protein [Chlamydiales bacterium]
MRSICLLLVALGGILFCLVLNFRTYPTKTAIEIQKKSETDILNFSESSIAQTKSEEKFEKPDQKIEEDFSWIGREARPLLRDSWEASVTAGYLYLWTDVDDLAYAIQSDGRKSKFLNPKILPDNGFKLGVGIYLPHDGWDFAFNLTHLHARAPVHAQGHLTPQWILPSDTPNGFVDAVEAHWRLHLGLVDMELGRAFFLGRSLTMRPHIGMRYAIIRQKYLLYYIGGNLFPEGEDYVSMKNKFLAPGVRVGSDFAWKIKGGFGLYSKLAAALLYGSVYVHESEKVSFKEEKSSNLFDKFPMGKPILDIEAGVQWERPIFGHRYHLLLQAGCEMHLFFSQNQLFHFNSASNPYFLSSQGDMSIQGLSISGTFSY